MENVSLKLNEFLSPGKKIGQKEFQDFASVVLSNIQANEEKIALADDILEGMKGVSDDETLSEYAEFLGEKISNGNDFAQKYKAKMEDLKAETIQLKADLTNFIQFGASQNLEITDNLQTYVKTSKTLQIDKAFANPDKRDYNLVSMYEKSEDTGFIENQIVKMEQGTMLPRKGKKTFEQMKLEILNKIAPEIWHKIHNITDYLYYAKDERKANQINNMHRFAIRECIALMRKDEKALEIVKLERQIYNLKDKENIKQKRCQK